MLVPQSSASRLPSTGNCSNVAIGPAETLRQVWFHRDDAVPARSQCSRHSCARISHSRFGVTRDGIGPYRVGRAAIRRGKN